MSHARSEIIGIVTVMIVVVMNVLAKIVLVMIVLVMIVPVMIVPVMIVVIVIVIWTDVRAIVIVTALAHIAIPASGHLAIVTTDVTIIVGRRPVCLSIDRFF